MDASDVMTKPVVSVHPEISITEIARLLLAKNISAVPVVDSNGAPIGIVSESDLIGPDDRAARRDWWLTVLAEGEPLSSEFLEWLRSGKRKARYLMSAPVVSVTEHTNIGHIAQVLLAHHIKRVPVVREGRLVGIVSRGDLLRTLVSTDPSQ